MRWPAAGLLLGFSFCPLLVLQAQPRLVVSEKAGYSIGDLIESEISVLDSEMRQVKLLDLFDPDSAVVVLSLIGGGARQLPEGGFRGPLWCEDTFDDLGVQRALISHFKGKPVQFLAVAVAPVFSTGRYGFQKGVFLDQEVDSQLYGDSVEAFIQSTRVAQLSTLIPYEHLFFDPKGLLIRKPASGGSSPVWQGRLKWPLDPRTYGLPTIWLLDSSGRVLREPFWGNDYAGTPPSVRYGFRELREAVDEALKN